MLQLQPKWAQKRVWWLKWGYWPTVKLTPKNKLTTKTRFGCIERKSMHFMVSNGDALKELKNLKKYAK